MLTKLKWILIKQNNYANNQANNLKECEISNMNKYTF